MKARSYLLGALLVGAMSAWASEPVTVLGLPLGGKLKMPMRQCRLSEDGTTVKSICWVDKPFAYKDSRSGMALVPDPDSRPRWAAHATFDLTVKTNGTLDKVTVESYGKSDETEIIKSVSSRWGAPDRAVGAGGQTEWRRPDVYIGLLCSERKCKTDFLSADYFSEWMRELDARKRKDAARPISP